MHLFVSAYENKIDKKGRVSIPARFRHVIKTRLENSITYKNARSNSLIVFPSPVMCGLEACDKSFIQRIVKNMSMKLFSPEEKNMSQILSNCHELIIDTDGRVILPEVLLKYAELSDRGFFRGMGDRFQIVNEKVSCQLMINKPLFVKNQSMESG